MERVPCTSHVLVDLDCDALDTGGGKRCDYVFVGEGAKGTWVVPIELKSGSFSGENAAGQLQAGADSAGGWLPAGAAFTLAPVLAHNGVNKKQLERLRRARVSLRGRTAQPLLMHCGAKLRDALSAA